MNERIISRKAYHHDIEILTNPEKYLGKVFLEKLSPYIIKTGIAYKVDVELRHDCDCDYCDHVIKTSLIEESMEKLKETYDDQDFYVSDPEKFEDCEIKEMYFAKAINQKPIDTSKTLIGDSK